MSERPADLGHVGLGADDEHDVVEGPQFEAPHRSWLQPKPPVVGTSAAEHVRQFFAGQRGADTIDRIAAPVPAPEIPARPIALGELPRSARQLAEAASTAGWIARAFYARGPYPTEKSLCPRCGTWQRITKRGALTVHGPRADRCQQAALDPSSPTYQTVDSVIVRARSPRGHRLAAAWVDDGEGYALDAARLAMVGDRPRDIDVVAVRGILKAGAA